MRSAMYERPDPCVELLRAEDETEQARQHALARETERAVVQREARRAAEQEEAAQRRIVATNGAAIRIGRPRWLWKNRIPLGGLSLIAGRGAVGKSTLFAQFVAWITTGDMHGEYYGCPMPVLYVVNEESIENTVKPRMLAHGADMRLVEFLGAESPLGKEGILLPRDIELLRHTIADRGAVATFLDPLSANVSGRANDQRDTRHTYQEINRLAEETRTSITGLAHTRKAGAADIMEAILGSSEQGNVARSVHGLVMDPEQDDTRILSCEKLNDGNAYQLPSLCFTLRTVDVADEYGNESSASKIHWEAEIDDTASDVLTDQMMGHAGADECAAWLLKFLTENGGEALASDVRQAAGRKYSETMLVRARKKAKVRSKRLHEVPPRTMWIHPGNAQSHRD